MTGLVGADIAAQRDLASKFTAASEALSNSRTTLDGEMSRSTSFWGGLDADEFRGDWGSYYSPAMLGASSSLDDAARLLLRNADQQEQASTDTGGPGGGGEGGGKPGGPTGRVDPWDWTPDHIDPGDIDTDIGDKPAGPWAITAIKEIVKAALYGNKVRKAISLVSAVKNLSLATSLDDVLKAAEAGRKALGLTSTFARGLGFIGGAAGIVGGVMDIINPDHEGWRGVGDRASGVLSVIGGAGSMAIAAGLLTNPVGIGIVVGAGVVAGAWKLGNLIYDNWDSITGFFKDPRSYLSDGWKELKDIGSNAVETVKDWGSKAVSAVDDGLSKAGNWVKGLFS